MPSPCAECPAYCCRLTVAPLSGYDMWRIARGLEYPSDRFVAFRTARRADSHSYYLERSGPAYYITLDKVGEGAARRCTFLLELPGGAARCGIYGLRPTVCRTYPAVMHGVEIEKRTDVLCPDGSWLDGSLQAPS